MSEYVNVAVDAMGGDNAPGEIIKGTVDALNAYRQLRVMLVGREEIVKEELAKYTYPEKRVRIVNATEIIEMAEPPVNAIRKKKDSSIVKGLQLVKEGKCDAFISAGSTGAILAGGQLIVGRIRGIERSPLAPLIPTSKGPALLIDCGANMDARPSQLVQFAQMGSIYMKNITGNPNPRVAIVNVGAEEEKGNALVKETFPLLKACDNINFIGSIEARDITDGYADVIVCDAFVGNVILKMFEGVASTLLHGMACSSLAVLMAASTMLLCATYLQAWLLNSLSLTPFPTSSSSTSLSKSMPRPPLDCLSASRLWKVQPHWRATPSR